MKGPYFFHVDNNFSFSKDDCYSYKLPLFMETFQASFWLNAEELAKQIIELNAGVFTDIESELGIIIQTFTKLESINTLPVPVKRFVKYTLNHYKKPGTKQHLEPYFKIAVNNFSVNKASEESTSDFQTANNIIHGSSSKSTADSINNKDENEDNKGYESDDYHPRRTRTYTVNVVDEDDSSVSYFLYHFKASIVNQMFPYCRQKLIPL